MLKDTGLSYIVTYEELLRKAEQIGNYKANLIPALLVIAAIYIAVNSVITYAAGLLERRTRRAGKAVIGLNPADQAGAGGGMGAGGDGFLRTPGGEVQQPTEH